jgi:hypothetical protein
MSMSLLIADARVEEEVRGPRARYPSVMECEGALHEEVASFGWLACEREAGFRLTPLTLREANAFVGAHHRHLGPKAGARFAVGAVRGIALVGVAIVSRPSARLLDDAETAEIARLATDGTRNACSFLLSRVARIVRLMGYKRLITYTLSHEQGASLRASGWRYDGITSGGGWDRPSRPRAKVDLGAKHRWWAW